MKRYLVTTRNDYPPFVTRTWQGVVIGQFLCWFRVLVREEDFRGTRCRVRLFRAQHIFVRKSGTWWRRELRQNAERMAEIQRQRDDLRARVGVGASPQVATG